MAAPSGGDEVWRSGTRREETRVSTVAPEWRPSPELGGRPRRAAARGCPAGALAATGRREPTGSDVDARALRRRRLRQRRHLHRAAGRHLRCADTAAPRPRLARPPPATAWPPAAALPQPVHAPGSLPSARLIRSMPARDAPATNVFAPAEPVLVTGPPG